MVFTRFSAHSHFVQTLFFQSFPCKFASKFRLFFAWFFIEKIEKIGSKISSEPDFAVGSTFCSILAHFFRFLVHFGRILGGLGRLGGSIFGVFGASKKEAKFERIVGSIFEGSGRVRRSAVGCSDAFRHL